MARMSVNEQLERERRQTVPMLSLANDPETHGRGKNVLFLATPEECAWYEIAGTARQIAPDFGQKQR